MQRPLHPLHALLLAGTLPLFLGVLFTDIAYYNTQEIQWKNFAAWLLVGAALFCGLTALSALMSLILAGWRNRANLAYLGIVLAAFILAVFNSFVHAGDAWASMPQGLVLSVICTVLMLVAIWLGFFSSRPLPPRDLP